MNEKRRFHFHPYEVNSEFDGKPHAFTKAFWQGEERELALALVGGRVRFCEVGKLESGEWNFSVEEKIGGRPYKSVNPGFIENDFKTALAKGKISRIFYWGGRAETYGIKPQWVLVKPDNQIVLSFDEGNRCFESCIELSFMESPSSQWYSELEKLIAGDSDLGFSIRWNAANDVEKAWLLTRLENGTRADMETIARLILQLYWRESMSIKLLPPRKSVDLETTISTNWHDSDGNKSKSYLSLLKVFLQYFDPRLNLQICKKYSSAKASDKYSLIFNAEIPVTEHEQLEIKVRLRQWLKGKVPDDQIDTLIS